MRKLIATTIALLLSMHIAIAAEPSTEAKIAQAIEQLGDDSFRVREDAAQFLWKAGPHAEPALAKAVGNNDAEVAARARQVLSKLELGIFPETPPEVVEKLVEFRDHPRQYSDVLIWLERNKHYRSLLTLVRNQKDHAKRRDWAISYLTFVPEEAARLLAAGDLTQAARLLELAAVEEDNMRHWAAFHVLQGSTAEPLARLQAELQRELPPDVRQHLALQLTYLLRARGDLNAACKAAEATGDAVLLRLLRQEAGDWDALSQHSVENPVDDNRRSDQLVGDPFFHDDPFASRVQGRLGLVAAWHRLAGRPKLALAELQRVEKLGITAGWQLDFVGALLLNDEFERALPKLNQRYARMAFDLLVYRKQYRAAFAQVGVKELRPPYTRWFQPLVDDPQLKLVKDKDDFTFVNEASNRFYHGLRVARQLHALGEPEEAKQMLNLLEKAAAQGDQEYRLDVVVAKIEVGQREEGLAAADELFDKHSGHRWFSALYGTYGHTAAQAIWAVLREKHPGDSVIETFQRLEHWLGPGATERGFAKEWGELMREVIEANDGTRRSAYKFNSLAKISRARGDDAAELTLLKAAIDPFDDVLSCAAGEFYLRHQQWEPAARWFAEVDGKQLKLADERRAAVGKEQYPLGGPVPASKPDNLLAIYLHGYALTKLGHLEEGQRKMQLAELLPLADGKSRFLLAETMERLELNDAARGQWQLIVRTEAAGVSYQHNAGTRLGNQINKEHPLRAADLWQHMMLSTLERGFFVDAANYLELPHSVHETRGKGLLAAGDADGAVREFDLAMSASPGEIKLPVHVVPLLEKADRHDDASRIFTSVYEVNEQVCQDFPRSADHHNRCAWLAARCRMRLDDALVHAEKAVELAPENVAYLDTLAEVHFAQGDRGKAIEIMRRCVKMAPDEEEFRARLDEFEKNGTKSETSR